MTAVVRVTNLTPPGSECNRTRGPRVADGLHGVLHLVQPALGAESRGVRIISSRHLEVGEGAFR
jgi:hypothetical protein